MRLSAPTSALTPAALLAHYDDQITAFEAKGLLVEQGRAHDQLRGAIAEIARTPGAVVRVHVDRELSGGESPTTNNRMELLSVIRGLQALNAPSNVEIHLDSSYVMDSFTKGWAASWQRNGWRKKDGKPAANPDLLQALTDALAPHTVRWVKVKGHAGVELNERVDRLAVVERDRAARQRVD